MSAIFGREVGAAGNLPAIHRLVWQDLTAGDGVPEDGMDWRFNCSPGILAYHATKSQKPVRVTLYEIQPATFDRLVASLDANLPRLGYERAGDTSWRCGQADLEAVYGNGAEAPAWGISRTDAVLVSNDPNAITTWAMRPTFAEEVAARAWCFRSVSTMGCNVGGLKRSEPAARAGWFDLVKQQEAALPRHRDLLLAAIEGDAAQWAYLMSEPTKWRNTVRPTVQSAFKKYGYGLEMAWHRHQPEAYERIKARLFLTRDEREL
jgi:hypothetical protein